MYADDCMIYCTGNNWDRVHNTLQQSLAYVTRWLGQNALKLNVKKSKCLVILAKSKLRMIDREVLLTVDDQSLDFIENYNYLGFILDAEMSLKPLLSHVKKITTTKIKTLYKIRKYIDTPGALAIYKQMILPLLDYSSFLLLACPKTDREDMQIIQNNALRLCNDVRLSDRITLIEIHSRANLLSLEQRRCIQLLSLLFRHGQSNENVSEIPARNTRAATIRKYKTEIYKNSKYKNSLYYKAAKYGDTLPRHIRDIQTVHELKRHLKILYAHFDDNFYLT